MKVSKLLCSLLVLSTLYMMTAHARLSDFPTSTTGIYSAELDMSGFSLNIGLDPPKATLQCVDKDGATMCAPTKVTDAVVTIGGDYVKVQVPTSGTDDKCTQIPAFEFGVENIVPATGGSYNGFLVLYMPNGQNVTMGERCITVDAAQGLVAIDWLDEQMTCVTLNTDETTTPVTGCTAPAVGQAATSFVVSAKLDDRQTLPEPEPTVSPTPSPLPSSSSPSAQPSPSPSPKTSEPVEPNPSHSHAAQSSTPQGRDSSNKSNDAPKSYIYSAVAFVLVLGTILASHFNLLRQ